MEHRRRKNPAPTFATPTVHARAAHEPAFSNRPDAVPVGAVTASARSSTVPGRSAVAALGALLGLALGGCSTDQLPDDAVLTISPTEHVVDIVERRDAEDRCTFDDDDYLDVPIVLALTDAQGSPIGGAELAVYVDFASNTYGGYPALALYQDRNGNGVVDAETELVSGIGDDIARVRTSEYGGAAALLLRMNVTCGYRGRVFAFTEHVAASAAVEVNPKEIIEPDPPADDPAETDPATDEPADTVPPEDRPTETDPVETDPAETDPAETDPAETDPAETDPVASAALPGGERR